MSTKPFFNHIAGLRGIAILLVILFHLSISNFPHGFYGVDIFLVISGYLLFLSLQRNQGILNLKEFACKRLLRIFPPMLALVLIVLLASIWLHDWEDIMNTARTGRHTLFCTVNNFLRRTQDNYFAATAIENPFLHMWYLAVTIQIYLIYTAGCVAYRFIPRKVSIGLIWGIGICSFLYGYSFQITSILQALHLPCWEQAGPVSHYSTLPRLWEPLSGGLILLLPAAGSRLKSNILTAVGLMATILPALCTHSIADYGVPLVVVGTMLIIRYMPESQLAPVLSNKGLMWIGSISFSLYLVHMPIIAFYHTWYQNISDWTDYMIIILLTICLSYAFWYLVEKRKYHPVVLIVMWSLGLLLCILGKDTQGYKEHLRADINAIKVAPYNDWSFCRPDVLADKLYHPSIVFSDGVFDLAQTTRPIPEIKTPLLQIGPASTNPTFVLFGDSHAQSAYFGIHELCKELNKPGVFLSSTVMPFWDWAYPSKSNYFFNREKAEAILDWLKAHPCLTHVIIAQHWRLRLEEDKYIHWDMRHEKNTSELLTSALREFLQRLNAIGKHVILLGPGPELHVDSPTRHIRIATRTGQNPINLEPVSCSRTFALELNKEALKLVNTMQNENLCSVIDAISFIPESTPFCSYQNGRFLMRDDDHFTGDGSIYLFKQLRQQLETLLVQPAP